jgi:hypothetical protein
MHFFLLLLVFVFLLESLETPCLRLVPHVKLTLLLDVNQPQIPYEQKLIYLIDISYTLSCFKVTIFMVLIPFCLLVLFCSG